MKKTRLLTLLAAMLLCVRMSAYDFSAVATHEHEYTPYEVTLYYTINADGATVTVAKGPEAYSSEWVEIPETVEYEGNVYTVSAIGYQAFEGSKVGAVLMANTITEVQDYAFHNSSVDSVRFSTGLKRIGDCAFRKTPLTNVILPEGVESLGEMAFQHYTSGMYAHGPLLYVYVPNSVISIGGACFAGHSALQSFTFPENLEVIEAGMFSNNPSLSRVTLPKKLKKISSSAFSGCPISEIEFPTSLEVIENHAFNGCSLTSVVLPNSVTTVGEKAFEGNKFMTSIVFSSGMTHLPSDVCSGCERLVDVTIPEGIISVGKYAFYKCALLSHVTFPESVAEIGEYALSSSGIVDFKFPQAITTIPRGFFSDCKMLAEYVIPNTISVIEYNAFYGCSNLQNVIIPESVTGVGSNSFADCTSLHEVEIPGSLTMLGGSMFDGCTSLSRVVLSEGLKKLNGGAFKECTSLKEITLPESLEEIEGSAFANSGLTNIVIPSNVKKIYYEAFYNCEDLTKVVIPHSVAYMGGNMFLNCNNLTEVHYQRAILPEPTSYYESYTKIHANNVCTLYVPRGAKTVFEADENWNKFMAIVEEDVPNVYYELSAKVVKGKGSVTVGEENIAYNKVNTLLNSAVTVTFTPAEGYMIETVLCNGEDITAELGEALQYEIASVEANYQFEVYYKEKPVTLHLVSGQGGSIDLLIEKGNRFTCNFKEEEGWRVNTVLFNGGDVTSDWSAADGYTTPTITGESTLSVSFELVNSVANQTISRLKAYSREEGVLTIEGLTAGEQVCIYSTEGKLEASFNSSSSTVNVSLPTDAIYVVNTANGSVKVGM